MDGKIIFKVYQIAACICLSANKYDYERHKEKNTKPSSQSWLLGSAWISSHSVISLGTPVIAAPSPGNENFGKSHCVSQSISDCISLQPFGTQATFMLRHHHQQQLHHQLHHHQHHHQQHRPPHFS